MLIFRIKSPYQNLLACLALCLLVGCDKSIDCSTNIPARFNVRFVKKGTGTGFGSDFPIKFDTIWVLGSDSVYYTGRTTSVIALPFNPTSDTTTIVFKRYGASQKDIVVLTYQRKYQLISPSCAPAVDFTNINLLSTSDSLGLPTITNATNDPNQNNVQFAL